MIQDMNKTLTRLFTIALLMMVSMGARAEVKVLFGEKGTELQPGKDGTITLGQKELTGGTIIISQIDQKDGTSKVTFAVTPDKNYKLAENGLEVYAVIPTDISPTRGLEVSTALTLKSEDFKDEALKRTYTTTIDSKLALWVKSVKFSKVSPPQKGPVQSTITSSPSGIDYSGIYYIANRDAGNYIYQNPEYYYLCPATNYYDADDLQPFLTTYKTNRDDNSKWQVIFVKTDNGVDYYYLYHIQTEKYLTFNDKLVSNNADRVRVHLQSEIGENDKSLFYFTTSSYIDEGTKPNFVTENGLNIIPKGETKSLNPAKNNFNSYDGKNESNPGSFTDKHGNTVYCGGLIGIYTASDARGLWYLEDSMESPIISPQGDNQVKITCPVSAEIFYTTDGSDPKKSTTSFTGTEKVLDMGSGLTVVKAVVKDGDNYSSVANYVYVKTGESNVYFIQSIENSNFYMIPGDLNGSNTTVNTTSLAREIMQWYLMEAVSTTGKQCFYVVNKSTGYYLYRNGNNLYEKAFNQSDDSKANYYKFSIVQYVNPDGTAGGLNIVPPGATVKIYKGGTTGTSNGESGAVTMNVNNSSAQSQWKLIPIDEYEKSSIPFTPSVGNDVVYYKIGSVASETNFIAPPTSGSTNITTSTVNSVNAESVLWYFEEAETNDLITYYKIVNAETNKCVYFKGSAVASNQTDAFELKDYSDSEADRYKFAFAKTITDGQYYIVPKMTADVTKNNYHGIWRDGTNTLQTRNHRSETKIKWTITESDVKVIKPVITYDPATNSATISSPTPGATIYYTVDGSKPTTSSTSTPLENILLEKTITTIRAIAVKGDVTSEAYKVCIRQGSSYPFLLQSKESSDFYMSVGDVSGTNTTVNTSSLPQEGMKWFFEDAGIVSGTQYYYIKNTSAGYLQRNGDNLYIVSTKTDNDAFKFNIVPYYDNGTLAGYNIHCKAVDKYVHKSNGNGAANPVYLNANAGEERSRWNIIALSDKDFTLPIEVSDNTSATYYTFESSAAAGYFITTPSGTVTNVTTSNGTSDSDSQKWYFKEAGNDGWATYYYILNAVTGEAMCFNKEAVNTTQTDALVMKVLPNEPTDNFKFTLAKTMNADEYYIIPKPLAHFTKTNYTGVWRAGNTAILQTSANRATNNIKWKVSKAEEGYVAPPVISYNPTTNEATITCTTPGAKIYYTIGNTEATTNSNLFSTTVPFTFELEEGTLHIRAIAYKDGVGTSTETDLPIPVQTTIGEKKRPYLIRSNNVSWTTDDGAKNIYYVIPSDDDGNGNTTANTTTMPRPTMEWYFKDAGLEGGQQYYYIENVKDGKCLYHSEVVDGGNTNHYIYVRSFGEGGNGFKFYLIERVAGYNIVPYGITDWYLNKNSNNTAMNALNLEYNKPNNENTNWNFVTKDDLDISVPFTPLPAGENSSGNITYHKIEVYHSNEANRGYFIIPPTGSATSATTSNSESESMKWFFKIAEEHTTADADDWVTYYHIMNAVTGEYLYYTGTQANNSLKISSTIDGGNANAYQFVIYKSPQTRAYYITPRPLRDEKLDRAYTLYRDNSNLHIGSNRNINNISWTFPEVTFKCATPVITYDALTGKMSITCTTPNAKIYYKRYDTEPTSSDIPALTDIEYSGEFDAETGYYKAVAVRSTDGSDMSDAATSDKIEAFQCTRPIITKVGNHVTITCATPGATIFYIEGENGEFSETAGNYGGTIYTEGGFDTSETVIRAIAVKGDWGTKSAEARYDKTPQTITSGDQITNMDGVYIVGESFTPSSNPIGSATDPFTGEFDGNYKEFELTHPLFAYTSGATIKNVIISSANISTSGSVGAIAGVAGGYTRIYNCGILPNDATNSNPSSVGSTTSFCGGLVGWLRDDSRVINCYSYANITGGTDVAGIVGHNDIASTTEVTDGKYANLRTAVVNCMFYGNITGGSNRYPVYGGEKMLNNTTTGINNYDFYRAEANIDLADDDHYNCSWPAKEEYLTRYEYYRYLLNSNRELCGWWVGAPAAPSTMATADVQAVPKDASLMAKWVLDPSVAPYPILKPFGYYSSPINIDADASWRETANEWEGRKLGTINVTINPGTYPDNTSPGVSQTSDEFIITDMDTLRVDYCYRKIQLPYYNKVFGNPNATTWAAKYGGNYGEYVVTGWDITTSEGTAGTLVENWETGYNFADRNCTAKDTKRTFAQGGYYYVPNNVTSITITAHWGKAIYLGNGGNNFDRVDFHHSSNKPGTAFAPAGTRDALGNGKTIYTDKIATVAANLPSSGTVYDNAIVLVGNHQYCTGGEDVNPSRSFTIMSADFDLDNEPDYCLDWQLGEGTNRKSFCPIRFDFLPVVEIGLGLKKDGSTQYYSLGCYRPLGHFEVTETALIHFGQFEFSNKNRSTYAPLILNGGIFDQYTKGTKEYIILGADDKIDYIIIGGNVKIPTFSPGAHVNSSANYPTRHCAVNVIGGNIDYLYLTGNYNESVSPNKDNPHCYIDGGRFMQVAAAGKEGIAGDVTFKINHSKIWEFYGGSTMDKADGDNYKIVKGSIDVTIDNSLVEKYCGGPKFGDMDYANGKTITTNATGTTFGVYYGGGNGGTSYVQYFKTDGEQTVPYSFGLGDYTPTTYANPATTSNYTAEGYMADYDMEIVNVSTGTNSGKAVYRTYFYAAQFSATNTGPITNNLTDCTVITDFFGGGNLGGVMGDVKSKLMGTTHVYGSAYGAGYSASIPTVTIRNKDKTAPTIDVNTGIITPQSGGTSTTYTWTSDNTLSRTNPVSNDGKYFFTEKSLTNLGAVSGAVTLTIRDNCVIGTENDTTTGNVYGGGDASAVINTTNPSNASTTVNLQGNVQVLGNVFGGGNEGPVSGSTMVNIEQ